jgi:hypothetical protein
MSLFYDNNNNNNYGDSWNIRFSGLLGLKYYITDNNEILMNKDRISIVINIIKSVLTKHDIDDIIIEYRS